MLGEDTMRKCNCLKQTSGLANIMICVNRHMKNETALALP